MMRGACALGACALGACALGLSGLGGCHLVGGLGELAFDGVSTDGADGGGAAGGAGGGDGGGGMGGAGTSCGNGTVDGGELCFAAEPALYTAGIGAVDLALTSCHATDNDPDVVVVGWTVDGSNFELVLSVLASNGRGQLSNPIVSSEQVSAEAEPVALALGGFATADLAVGVVAGYLTYDGTGSCGYLVADAVVPMPTIELRDLAAVALDNDAVDDLVATTDTGLLIHTSSGSATTQLGTMAASPGAIATGLMDGDNLADAVYVDTDGDAVYIALQQGDSFDTSATSSGSTGGHPAALALGDVDGDSVVDVVTADQDDSTITVLINNGNAVLSSTAFSTEAGELGRYPVDVSLGDADGDGDLDAIVAGSTVPGITPSLTLLLNDGSGSFAIAPGFPIAVAAPAKQVRFFDLNQDAALDIVYLTVATGGDSTVGVILANP